MAGARTARCACAHAPSLSKNPVPSQVNLGFLCAQETCTTYNALKVIKHAFGWTADPKLADQYEWTLRNAILPVQKPLDPGRMLYMLPHGPYMNGTPTTKADAGGGGGWSTWNGSYWW